jgi:long-chain acyl-CoA synthetase
LHKEAVHLQQVLNYWAQQQPDRVLLFAPEPNLRITYRQLLDEARHLHAWFDQLKISEHGHIGLFMHNGRQTTGLFLGTMVGGRVITPFNLLAPPEQLAYSLDHSDIEILFYAPLNKDALLAALPHAKRKFMMVELDPDAAVGPYIDTAAITLPEISENHPALLMYTSGTTGTPKGVLLSHRNLMHAGKSIGEWHSLGQNDVVLSSLPIYHINER